ncbi:MAG TPA: hypothetical protein VGN39_10650 [Terriglobales bacterium]|nr:hypothetical protein [Terriglobales bacterium]
MSVPGKMSLVGFVAVVLASSTAVGQNIKPSDSPTLFVQCDYPSRPPKNVVVTSPELVAKYSGYRAWLQVVSAAPSSGATCYNTTVLWFSGGINREYRQLYTVFPEQRNLEGSGMRLVDWSRDGQLLLTELWQWNTEPNDAPFVKRILVFQPKSKSKFEINFDPLLEDQKGKDCFVEFQLLGFTDTNWVALKTHISTLYGADEAIDGVPADKVCKEKTQTWAVDPATQKWHALPASFTPIRYAD